MKRPLFAVAFAMSLLAFFGISDPARALEVGSAAPMPTAIDEVGASVNFADVYKQGVTLVYFYPKADTGGCTAEACSLRDSYVDLRKAGVQVLGVSMDKEAAQKSFKDKYKLPFTLIADHDGKVAAAFEVPTLMGFAKRQSFLVKDGKIAWLDKSASTKQQGDDVRKALETLGVHVAAATSTTTAK